jgi:hypothetical protein
MYLFPYPMPVGKPNPAKKRNSTKILFAIHLEVFFKKIALNFKLKSSNKLYVGFYRDLTCRFLFFSSLRKISGELLLTHISARYAR